MVTDYDVWHEEEVNVAMVVQNLNNNVANAQKIIKSVINKIHKERKCVCASAVRNAVMTNKELFPEETKKRMELII
jgi:5'-methylthioadenosine phosphorylase